MVGSNVPPALLLGVTVAMAMVCSCGATFYLVGGLAGWDMSTYLDSWLVGKTFLPGDILSFQFSSYYDLHEVTKEGYDSCNSSNAIFTSTTGNASIALAQPGPRFFICGVRLYCLSGLKLQVNTLGNGQQSGGPAAAPALAPPVVQQPAGAGAGGLITPPQVNGNPSFSSSAAASVNVGAVLRGLVFLWGQWAVGTLSWISFRF
ncbi:umecyanin-like [Nymphaea colorata]|nr:umecyanin-like [Nymphaea colorata]